MVNLVSVLCPQSLADGCSERLRGRREVLRLVGSSWFPPNVHAAMPRAPSLGTPATLERRPLSEEVTAGGGRRCGRDFSRPQETARRATGADSEHPR